MTFKKIFNNATPTLLLSNKDIVSRENVENVVKAPKNPVNTNKLTCALKAEKANNTPAKNEPKTFAKSTPSGNVGKNL